MGFWSSLGKVASVAGPLIAAPFTGGASLLGLSAGGAAALGAGVGAAGGLLSRVGEVAEPLAAGRAAGRIDESKIQAEQDRLAQERYRNQLSAETLNTNRQFGQANLDLNQRQFGLQAPQARASNAVRGDILANAQDFAYGTPSMVGNIPVPTSTGGLRPSIFSENTRNIGRLMSEQALSGQQVGDNFTPLTFPTLGAPPSLTPLPEEGGLDKVLKTAGTVGALGGTFADFLKRYQDHKATTARRDIPPAIGDFGTEDWFGH